ncbi:thiamine diphosphokinase [Paenibacillus selenitireducens]|uniref:Thiamine diphosphokinase n=2 Tax=Paenibacillus selenitireducens TaxID=1324314 RepID=A0A1T2X419_9BACL|nr:thiamine diphosphokinase [Paenibacillus selenitireducens]OPA74644.1 thiamine diphosphokinase [Paenibacillus selenitireducens]
MQHTKTKVVIFSGGQLSEQALKYIQPEDFIIGADRGAAFLTKHGIHMDIAVGDFDSVTEEMKIDIAINCDRFIDCDPVYKNLTDTEMAFEIALEQQPVEIMMLGALGTRFDHSLSNVHLLRRTLELGIQCTLADDHNEICLMDARQSFTVMDHGFTYVSLLPLSMEVTGVTLEGFQYPLHQATLTLGKSLSVSNELVGEKGIIHIADGVLLVIQSKD